MLRTNEPTYFALHSRMECGIRFVASNQTQVTLLVWPKLRMFTMSGYGLIMSLEVLCHNAGSVTS